MLHHQIPGVTQFFKGGSPKPPPPPKPPAPSTAAANAARELAERRRRNAIGYAGTFLTAGYQQYSQPTQTLATSVLGA